MLSPLLDPSLDASNSLIYCLDFGLFLLRLRLKWTSTSKGGPSKQATNPSPILVVSLITNAWSEWFAAAGLWPSSWAEDAGLVTFRIVVSIGFERQIIACGCSHNTRRRTKYLLSSTLQSLFTLKQTATTNIHPARWNNGSTVNTLWKDLVTWAIISKHLESIKPSIFRLQSSEPMTAAYTGHLTLHH